MASTTATDASTPEPTPQPTSAPWRRRIPWLLIGVVAGTCGLGTSYLTSAAMNMRLSPVTAVFELVRDASPGKGIHWATTTFGTNDKRLLIGGILVFLVLAFAGIGLLARRAWWLPVAGYGLLAVVGIVATLHANGAMATDLAPILIGYVTWVVATNLLGDRLRELEGAESDTLPHGKPAAVARDASRRSFLITVGAVAGVAALAGLLGRVAGGGRRKVEEARRLLRLPGTQPVVPADALIDVDGVSSWMTPARRFYLIDTAAVKPTITPPDWSLRIHGMVENEITIGYDDLVVRDVLEAWVTLNCVSNYVGGSLIGNAWWTGTSLADLIAEAKPLAGADAILQTSDDGWTCGTPLDVVTDGRDAMLAYAMNGEPLEIEHGFPVRTLVPGLYGYVSATKWVREMKVSRFSDFAAFWTTKGWSEKGPVKMSSRVEVPRSGDHVAAGDVTFAGTAWSQHTGISAVQVNVDGGAWLPAELAGVPSTDCWVQWKATVPVERGGHVVRVRAIDANGLDQTGVVRDVLPDGATGWDAVDFTAR